MALSDTAIRSKKPGTKPIKLADSNGLYLLLRPNGSRWWRWDYARPVTKKRNTLSFGTYPEVSLKQARERRDEARRLLAAEVDPGAQRKAVKSAGVERAANSFEVVAREWFEKQSTVWAKSHADKVLLRLENGIFPWLGNRPVADVSAPDLLQCLRRIENRGAIETAHRTLQVCGQVLRYAIATGRAERNPAADLKGALAPVTTNHHAAIIEPDAIGGLLRAIDGYQGKLATKGALRLAPLLFVRPGELRHAEWSEIDLDEAQWVIPEEKMKMRIPLIVPLAPQAVAIFREIQPVTGHGRYVFPSDRTPQRPMSDNAVLAALRRMGYTKDEMTGHGFRAMARTVLDEVLGFRPDIIEHQLAHTVRDPNGRAYNRTAHLPERQRMMKAWADYLDKLKSSSGRTGKTKENRSITQQQNASP